MKKVFIIHGWEGTSQLFWIPQLAKHLKDLGYDVVTPDMPNTDEPKIIEWVDYLREITSDIDEGTIFVGHSIGCQSIMRFLAEQNKKVDKCIFVAGWFNLINLEDEESEEIARPWIKTPIDFEKLKKNIGEILVVLGDQDEWVPCEETKKDFEEKLNAKVEILEGYSHMDKNLEDLPKLEAILKKEIINHKS